MSSQPNEVDIAFAEMLYSMAFGWASLGTPEDPQQNKNEENLSFKGKIRMFFLSIRAMCAGEVFSSYGQALGYLGGLKIPTYTNQDYAVVFAMVQVARTWCDNEQCSSELANAVREVLIELHHSNGRNTIEIFQKFIERNGHV